MRVFVIMIKTTVKAAWRNFETGHCVFLALVFPYVSNFNRLNWNWLSIVCCVDSTSVSWCWWTMTSTSCSHPAWWQLAPSASLTSPWILLTVGYVACELFFFLVLPQTSKEIQVTLPGSGIATARAALPIPISACRIFHVSKHCKLWYPLGELALVACWM